MNDLISRQAAIDACHNYEDGKDAYAYGDVVEKRLKTLPSADVAPVRHGHWVVIDAEEPRRYGCSKCKRLSWHMENYCPNCGALMEGEEYETD